MRAPRTGRRWIRSLERSATGSSRPGRAELAASIGSPPVVTGVPLQTNRMVSDLVHWLSFAARYYSLIRPPRTLRRRPGRSTAAGSSPRTLPPTWPPGPVSSAAATRTSTTPTRTRCALDLAHPRPARPSRPPAEPENQPGLALETGVPHLLAAALRPARARLTSTDHPSDGKTRPRHRRSRCAPGHTGHHRATAATN